MTGRPKRASVPKRAGRSSTVARAERAERALKGTRSAARSGGRERAGSVPDLWAALARAEEQIFELQELTSKLRERVASLERDAVAIPSADDRGGQQSATPSAGDPHVPAAEAARRLGVDISTVRRWIRDGRLLGRALKVRGSPRRVWTVNRQALERLERAAHTAHTAPGGVDGVRARDDRARMRR